MLILTGQDKRGVQNHSLLCSSLYVVLSKRSFSNNNQTFTAAKQAGMLNGLEYPPVFFVMSPLFNY